MPDSIVTTAETVVETIAETSAVTVTEAVTGTTAAAVTEAVAETTAATVAETVAATTAEAASMFGNIDVQPMNFVNNLGYMATGMVGIFVVIGVIIVATMAMNKFFSGKK